MKLKFPISKIEFWANRYEYEDKEAIDIGKRSRNRGYFSKEDFLEICEWKTPRSKSRCKQNSDSFIKEVTSIALSTKEDRIRIEILNILTGVGWPTASVLLHFATNYKYPIVDYRALWSIGIHSEVNKFDDWMEYVKFCRNVASKAKVNLRTLDKALWQYSKENQ